MIRIPRLVVFALAVPVVVTVARPLAKEIGKQLKKVGGLIEDAVEELNKRDAESEKKVEETEKPTSESSTSTSGQPAEPAEVEHPEEPVSHEQASSSDGAPAVPGPEESVKQTSRKRVTARRPAVKDKASKVAKESPKRTARRRTRDFETG